MVDEYHRVRRCFKCGGENGDGNQCVHCGASLPKVDSSISGDAATPRLRVKYELLRGQLGKVQLGQLSWEDFAVWLQEFHDDILGRMQYLIDCIQQSHGEGWNYYEEYTEEVETAFTGLKYYEQAFDLLWAAVDNRSLPTGEEALATFLYGAEKLNDALALNAQSNAGSSVDGFVP